MARAANGDGDVAVSCLITWIQATLARFSSGGLICLISYHIDGLELIVARACTGDMCSGLFFALLTLFLKKGRKMLSLINRERRKQQRKKAAVARE